MFVVVFLIGPKKLTVVPEHFIFDLDERKLKNLGVNSNQRYRIYFSEEWFQNQIERVNLEQEFIPNFNLPATDMYPLPDNVVEAVFVGHMRKFESKNHEQFILFLCFNNICSQIFFRHIRRSNAFCSISATSAGSL